MKYYYHTIIILLCIYINLEKNYLSFSKISLKMHNTMFLFKVCYYFIYTCLCIRIFLIRRRTGNKVDKHINKLLHDVSQRSMYIKLLCSAIALAACTTARPQQLSLTLLPPAQQGFVQPPPQKDAINPSVSPNVVFSYTRVRCTVIRRR